MLKNLSPVEPKSVRTGTTGVLVNVKPPALSVCPSLWLNAALELLACWLLACKTPENLADQLQHNMGRNCVAHHYIPARALGRHSTFLLNRWRFLLS